MKKILLPVFALLLFACSAMAQGGEFKWDCEGPNQMPNGFEFRFAATSDGPQVAGVPVLDVPDGNARSIPIPVGTLLPMKYYVKNRGYLKCDPEYLCDIQYSDWSNEITITIAGDNINAPTNLMTNPITGSAWFSIPMLEDKVLKSAFWYDEKE